MTTVVVLAEEIAQLKRTLTGAGVPVLRKETTP